MATSHRNFKNKLSLLSLRSGQLKYEPYNFGLRLFVESLIIINGISSTARYWLTLYMKYIFRNVSIFSHLGMNVKVAKKKIVVVNLVEIL